MKNLRRLYTFSLVNSILLFLCYPALSLDIEDLYYHTDNAIPHKVVSMDFKQAALNDVLKIFSQQSGLNFIASSDIADKTIDLYLDNVPVEEALERILFANDLTYELKPNSNIFVVKQLNKPQQTLITRVYHLKHATVPASKMVKQIDEDEDEEGGSAAQGGESEEEEETGGIIEAVQSVLSPDGTVVENPRTNSLVVTDLPEIFPYVEDTISRLDIRIPQILIEVEMLDVTKNTAELLGAKFGNTPFQFQGASFTDILPFEHVPSDAPVEITGEDGDSEPRYTVGTLSYAGLTVALQFLRTQTDTRNLARPRILTLNNETAEIQISSQEAIGTEITSFGEGAAAQTTTEAERFPTGVFLKVTPQANVQTGEITMVVEPKVVETIVNKNNPSFVDPEERGSKSVLRIQNGDTVILGGLLRTQVDDIRTNVPILSKIPLLGMAFRHKDKQAGERELIIFLTPHILNEQTKPTPALAGKNAPRIREQDPPVNRNGAVNRELSIYENNFQF